MARSRQTTVAVLLAAILASMAVVYVIKGEHSKQRQRAESLESWRGNDEPRRRRLPFRRWKPVAMSPREMAVTAAVCGAIGVAGWLIAPRLFNWARRGSGVPPVEDRPPVRRAGRFGRGRRRSPFRRRRRRD